MDTAKQPIEIPVRDAQDFLYDCPRGEATVLDGDMIDRLRGVASYAIENAAGAKYGKQLLELVTAVRLVKPARGSELPYIAELEAAENLLKESGLLPKASDTSTLG